VEARAHPTSSTGNESFRIYPYKLNKFWFAAILERHDQSSGWDYMSITIEWKTYYKTCMHKNFLFFKFLKSSTPPWVALYEYDKLYEALAASLQ